MMPTSRRAPWTCTFAPCAASSETTVSRRWWGWATGTAPRTPGREAKGERRKGNGEHAPVLSMTLRTRFTLLLAGLAAVTAVVLVLLVDDTIHRAVEDRVTERISEEMALVADDLSRVSGADADAFLRRTASELACRM